MSIVYGRPLEELEAYAEKLDASWPAPDGVSMQVSVMLASFADNDEKLLQKLRSAMSAGNIGSFINVLENMPDKFREQDLVMLRKTFEEKDWDGFSTAIRRLSGDHAAGTQTDDLKKFTGQYIRQDEITGEISKMPYLEERHQAAEITTGSVNPRSALGHMAGHTWHDGRMSGYLLQPAVEKKIAPEDHWYGHQHKTIMIPHWDPDDSCSWVQNHQFNVIQLNMANIAGDRLCNELAVEGYVPIW